MMGRKKFDMKKYHNLCLDELVSAKDLYRKIDETIDFSFIHELAKEAYSHTGQPSLDPLVFFKIELVGFLEGIHEDRALERRIKDSLAIRWFLGYDLDEKPPVHSTISRTRKDRIPKKLYEAVFNYILEICIRRQLVSGHHQSIDSTLLKANASLHSLEVLQPKVLAHYEKGVNDNDSESNVPPTPQPPGLTPPKLIRRDPEAKDTKKPGFSPAPYYKASASIDEACGIITHAQVDDANKNDAELLPSIVTATQQRLTSFGLKLESVGADKGFTSAENFAFLDNQSVTAYLVPRFHPNPQGGFDRSQFSYDSLKDQFICPEGKILKLSYDRPECSHLKVYRASKLDCTPCPQKMLCTTANSRRVSRSIYEPLIQAAIHRAQSLEGRQAGRLRQIQAEGTYAHLKEVLKFRKLYSLSLQTARKKFLIACSVINLKKLVRALDLVIQLFLSFMRFLKERLLFQTTSAGVLC